MPERGNNGSCAQADIFGATRQINQIKERVRRNRKIHPVMFAGPDRVHAAIVRDFAQLDKFFVQLFLILLWINPLHMRKQRKLHRD
jgi:hypothetical protein